MNFCFYSMIAIKLQSASGQLVMLMADFDLNTLDTSGNSIRPAMAAPVRTGHQSGY